MPDMRTLLTPPYFQLIFGVTLVQISFSPADLDSIRQVQSGSHQSRELLKGP